MSFQTCMSFCLCNTNKYILKTVFAQTMEVNRVHNNTEPH